MAERNGKMADGDGPEDSSVRDAESWVPLLIEGLQDAAVVFLDHEGRAMSWNPAIQRILGHERADFLGLPFERLFGPDDGEAARRQLDRARTAGRSEEECCYVRKDGQEVWVTGMMVALWGPHHRLRGYA